MTELIKACLGVLYCPATNQVLMARRPAGKLLAGYWEFPGGKLEAAEDSYTALSRELLEEIGLEVTRTNMQQLAEIEHTYPHGRVSLSVILVREWAGTPQACESQELGWFNLSPQSDSEVGQLPQPLLPTTTQVLQLLNATCAKNIFSNEGMNNATIS